MKLTPDTARVAYTLLSLMPPFDRWALPFASDIKFTIQNRGTYYGKCWTRWRKRRFHETMHFEIIISDHTVHTVERLLRVMAHEMIHIRQSLQAPTGSAVQKQADRHGKDFQAMQTEICGHMLWDDPLT